MKEFIITFSNGIKETSIRRYLSDSKYLETLAYIANKTIDKHGIQIVSCSEIKGITAKDFIPSII